MRLGTMLRNPYQQTRRSVNKTKNTEATQGTQRLSYTKRTIKNKLPRGTAPSHPTQRRDRGITAKELKQRVHSGPDSRWDRLPTQLRRLVRGSRNVWLCQRQFCSERGNGSTGSGDSVYTSSGTSRLTSSGSDSTCVRAQEKTPVQRKVRGAFPYLLEIWGTYPTQPTQVVSTPALCSFFCTVPLPRTGGVRAVTHTALLRARKTAREQFPQRCSLHNLRPARISGQLSNACCLFHK